MYILNFVYHWFFYIKQKQTSIQLENANVHFK